MNIINGESLFEVHSTAGVVFVPNTDCSLMYPLCFNFTEVQELK